MPLALFALIILDMKSALLFTQAGLDHKLPILRYKEYMSYNKVSQNEIKKSIIER
jgi:hypothetical protein